MAAREWGTTLSHLLTGAPGWADYDRLLVLALTQHDMDLCPSGAGPMHYADECDVDTTLIEPERIEASCIYLYEQQEWDEDRAQEKNPEKGILSGLVDGASVAVATGGVEVDQLEEPAHAEPEGEQDQRGPA